MIMDEKEEIKEIETDEEKETWQDRFVTEYKQLKERYNKLHKAIVQLEAGVRNITLLNCSLDLLKRQAKVMGEYLFVLEMRAELACIDLETDNCYMREEGEYNNCVL